MKNNSGVDTVRSCTFVLSDNVSGREKLLEERIERLGFRLNRTEPYVIIKKRSVSASDIEKLVKVINDACKPEIDDGFEIIDQSKCEKIEDVEDLISTFGLLNVNTGPSSDNETIHQTTTASLPCSEECPKEDISSLSVQRNLKFKNAQSGRISNADEKSGAVEEIHNTNGSLINVPKAATEITAKIVKKKDQPDEGNVSMPTAITADEKADNLEHDINKAVEAVSNKKYSDASSVSSNETDCFETTFNKSHKEVSHAGTVPLQTMDSCSGSEEMVDERDDLENDTFKKSVKGTFTSHDSKEKMDPSYRLEDQSSEGNVKRITNSHDSKEKSNPKSSETRRACMGDKRTSNNTDGELKEKFKRNQLMTPGTESSKKMTQTEEISILNRGKPEVEEGLVIKECRTRTRSAVGKIKQSEANDDCYRKLIRASNDAKDTPQQTQSKLYEEQNETGIMDPVSAETTKEPTRYEQREKASGSTRYEEREKASGYNKNEVKDKASGYTRNEEKEKQSEYNRNEVRGNTSGSTRNEKREKNEEREKPSGYIRTEEMEKPSEYIRNVETEKQSRYSRDVETDNPSGHTRNLETEKPSGYTGNKYKADSVSGYTKPYPYSGTTKAIEESSRIQTGSNYELPKEPDEPQIINNSNLARENLGTSEENFKIQMDTRHDLHADETSRSDKETHLNILTCDPSLKEYLYRCAKEFKETPVEAREGLQAREADYLVERCRADEATNQAADRSKTSRGVRYCLNRYNEKDDLEGQEDGSSGTTRNQNITRNIRPESKETRDGESRQYSRVKEDNGNFSTDSEKSLEGHLKTRGGAKPQDNREERKVDKKFNYPISKENLHQEGNRENEYDELLCFEQQQLQTGEFKGFDERLQAGNIGETHNIPHAFLAISSQKFTREDRKSESEDEGQNMFYGAQANTKNELSAHRYDVNDLQTAQVEKFQERQRARDIEQRRSMSRDFLTKPSQTQNQREHKFSTSRRSRRLNEGQDMYFCEERKMENELSAHQYGSYDLQTRQTEPFDEREQPNVIGERCNMTHDFPTKPSQRQNQRKDNFIRGRQDEGQDMHFDASHWDKWDAQSEDKRGTYKSQYGFNRRMNSVKSKEEIHLDERDYKRSDGNKSQLQTESAKEIQISTRIMASQKDEEKQARASDREYFDAELDDIDRKSLEGDKVLTKRHFDKGAISNEQTNLVEMDIEIDCNPKQYVTLLSSIAFLPKKKNCSAVNVSLDKISDRIISLNGKIEEVLLIKNDIKCSLRREQISSYVVRYEQKQRLPEENVASVRSSSLNRKPHGIDAEQDTHSNLGGARGLGRESSVDPPHRTLSEDLVTRNSGIKVKVLKTDITAQRVDAIVNAANSRLRHGGGVAKAIADKAGSDLVQECSRFTKGEKKVGVTELFVSSSGKLPAKHVIHAVGPNWKAYKEDRKEECARDLRRTVLNCLLEAAARGCHSIAIPSISAAIFGVPHPICTKAYLEAVQTYDIYNERHLQSNLKEILFVDIVDEMVGHIQRQFCSEWEQEPPLRQVTDDFQYARKLCEQKEFKNSQPDERGHQPKQTSPVTQSGSNTQRSFSAPRPTPSSSEATSQKLAGYLYSVGECYLCASTEAAFRQRPDLIVLIGQLFQNLHWSPAVDVEREININTDFPSKGNIFTILGGEKSFPLVVQFHIDKYDQKNLDRVFYDVGNYWSIIRQYIKQVQSVVFTSAALYSGSFQAGKYPYLVDEKFVGAFTRHVYEFLMKSALHSCSVTIAAGSEAMDKVHKVLESRQPTSGKPEATGGPSRNSENSKRECGVCFQDNAFPNSLACCNGDLCRACKENCQSCPFCRKPFKRVIGNQPKGTMNIRFSRVTQLQGNERHGSYEITYFFSSGTQQSNHPEPGKRYESVKRIAYVPASSEGHQVLRLLRLAFLRRLTFTIGESLTTGRTGVIVWNDIHHKTSLKEGSLYGYPDSNYLTNVTKDLAAKNVTESSMTKEEMRDLAKVEYDLKRINSFTDL
ncbi:E3 ubiquitin-protein ligase dtx3l [Plakobranchus ocellatus]|uniref:RING-type E3 ubiquitin transferase n=1 Tax=Plakobranchus ocellatus TaxID=259542 RepID=A0AAV4C4S3_9GAST|nr:E3 ubiquitin-protein ligase dtx3l [Plakobranchus ocellatus]